MTKRRNFGKTYFYFSSQGFIFSLIHSIDQPDIRKDWCLGVDGTLLFSLENQNSVRVLYNPHQRAQRNPMFVFTLDGALLRFNVKAPEFAPLFQLPPRRKPRAPVFDTNPFRFFFKKRNKNHFCKKTIFIPVLEERLATKQNTKFLSWCFFL